MEHLPENMPRIFYDDLEPRRYFGPRHNQAEIDARENDQTFSPLQQYINAQKTTSDAELKAVLRRIAEGDDSARAELVDKSLKLIRESVRKFNNAFRMDEDELINMIVERILSRPEYIDPKSELAVSTYISNFVRWTLARHIRDYTKNTVVAHHAFVALAKIRKTMNKLPPEQFEAGDPYEATVKIVQEKRLRAPNVPTAEMIQAIRMIGAVSLQTDFDETLRCAELPSGDPESRIELLDFKLALGRLEKSEEGRYKERMRRGRRVAFEHLAMGYSFKEIGQREGYTIGRIQQLEVLFSEAAARALTDSDYSMR